MGNSGKFVPHEQLALRDNKVCVSDEVQESSWVESSFKVSKVNMVDLPSKFLPYPPNAKISYRPYYYEEIKNHEASKNLTYREEVDFVLSGIYTSFDKYLLTLSDYLYLNVLRRMANIGDYDIVAKYKCGRGDHIARSVFKSSQLDIDYLKMEKLPIVVKFSSGKIYHFSPLTVGSYIELVEDNFKNKSVSMIAKCCINASHEEIYEFIRTLTNPDDLILANHLDSLLYHSLKPMNLKCNYKYISYVEKDGWTYEKLSKMLKNNKDKKQLLALFNKYEIKFVEGTDMIKIAFNDLVKKMALVKETSCGQVNSIELDGGDLFLGPFCNYGELIKNRICYGL